MVRPSAAALCFRRRIFLTLPRACSLNVCLALIKRRAPTEKSKWRSALLPNDSGATQRESKSAGVVPSREPRFVRAISSCRRLPHNRAR